MDRVLILGFSGAGKSTLARQLGEKIHIAPVYLDTLHWMEGWVERPDEKMIEELADVLSGARWIVEGSYRRVLFQERLKFCDTVIFLDFNRFLCFFRAVKRRIMYHKKSRPDMTTGCEEKLDFEFAKWLLSDGRKKRRMVLKELDYLQDKKVYIFKTPKEVEKFLNDIGVMNA